MDIYTSMEIRDDLIEGVSTFYAELKRINMILEHSRRDKPMIYLIDEIFRGTNSLDRITGAQVVLRQLSQNGAIGLISTHDFELCDLEKELWAKFKNFHFQEHYVNGGIEFDYKLRPGRCSTSNARYLMKMVGIDKMCIRDRGITEWLPISSTGHMILVEQFIQLSLIHI